MLEAVEFLTRLTKASQILRRASHIEYQYNKRSLVYKNKLIKLYHYHPHTDMPHSTPLLLVYATINRPEILDLFPEQSFINYLLAQGLDLYLLDWGYPDENNQKDTLNTYISNYLYHCVKFILENNKKKCINLLGICQGGILTLCYASLFNHIKNLILISTPIDFHTKNYLIANIIRHVDIDLLNECIHSNNISGTLLNSFFLSLKPAYLLGKKYFSFVNNIENEDKVKSFMQLEKWLYDTPDQPNKVFLELIHYFYLKNQLIRGELYFHKKKIDLTKITLPILNILAKKDEIVPLSSSRALKKYIASTDYLEKTFASGHIGIYINPQINKKMAITIATWIKQRN